MKVNKLKSLAVGLAISAMSTVTLAASGTITAMDDVPRRSGSITQVMSVSDQGTVGLMNFQTSGTQLIEVNTWSKSSGRTILGLTGTPGNDWAGAGDNAIITSLNGSRVALLNGGTSIIFGAKDRHTYIYTNGVEQIISGSVFAAYTMSGDGKTLGGIDSGKQPAIMDIDTGVITRINIANVDETNFIVKQLSDDGKTILIHPTYYHLYYYLVDRSGNVKSRINRLTTGSTPTTTTTRNVLDLSGDGSSVTFSVPRSDCHIADSGCLNIFQWTKDSSFVQITRTSYLGSWPMSFMNRTGSISTLRTEIWDNVAGKRHIINALQAKGVDTSGWVSLDLSNISSNGKYLVGTGTTTSGEYKRFLIENNTEPVCTTPTF